MMNEFVGPKMVVSLIMLITRSDLYFFVGEICFGIATAVFFLFFFGSFFRFV